MIFILLSFIFLCEGSINMFFNDTFFTMVYDPNECEITIDDESFKIIKINNNFINIEQRNICILTSIILFPFIVILIIWSIWCCCDCDKRCCRCCKKRKGKVISSVPLSEM